MPTPDTTGAPVGSAEVTSDADGVAVIELIGEIDLSNVDAARASIEPTLSKPHEQIVFDLDRLDFLDSSGIALVLWAAAQARSVELRRPTDIVRRIIEVTGLSDILQMDG
ncbi:MAG TPA: STAS domain-containing protein [Acidimicrobiia bacterium]|jgi:anti-sigma B factor antagonist|nr:STAS domain-containing protein [Acidimicrobiia bacterium]